MKSIFIASILLAGTASAQNLDNFDSGINPNGWEWNGFTSNVVEPTGGNPGGYLHGPSIQFANQPILTSSATTSGAWVGDYRANMVQEIRFDAQAWAGPSGFSPMAVILIDDKGTASQSDDDFAYYLDNTTTSPAPGSWVNYSFDIPSGDTSALPTGWTSGSGFSYGVPFSAGYDWNNLMQNVTSVEIWFGDPQSFGFGQTWDMGIDNLEVVVNTAFMLSMPTAGGPGGVATLETINATPNGVVFFGYSLSLGTTNASCGGVAISAGIQNGIIAGNPVANASGIATLLAAVPAAAAGKTVHIQALDKTTCALSNVLSHTF